MSPVATTGGRTHLTFIGGGTMACAILDGLTDSASTLKSGQESDYSFSITARRQERAVELSEQYPGAYVTDNNDDKKLWQIAKGDTLSAHIILICTKPQSTFDVCESIRLAYEEAAMPCTILPTVVTMCPGITISKLENWLSPQNHPKPFGVVRTMPNTPVSIRQGATALVASAHATATELDRVIALFRVFSPCVEILPEESLLDVAAAVSG